MEEGQKEGTCRKGNKGNMENEMPRSMRQLAVLASEVKLVSLSTHQRQVRVLCVGFGSSCATTSSLIVNPHPTTAPA